MENAMGIVGFLFICCIYFLPTFVAAKKGKRNTGAIFIVNLFLGLTVIGWVVALVWAVSYER